MKLPKLLESSALKEAMRKYNYIIGETNTSQLKILDCTYTPTPALPHDKFKEELFGKFEKLDARMSKHKFLYMREHIPGAIFLDIDATLYPSSSQRFTAYEPSIFEKYAQLIGLNADDHLAFYGRGNSLSSMIFPARMYWLFKAYGHSRLSILNGGLSSWRDEYGYDVESVDEILRRTKGNWKAENCASDFRITFNELNDTVFDKLDEVNLLDARTRPQFEGKSETGLDAYFVEGSHIPGTINVPALELITDKGKIKSQSEIKEILQHAGYRHGQPTYTMCMVGMQASLVSFALDALDDPISNKLYAGGLYEVGNLDPKRISSTSA